MSKTSSATSPPREGEPAGTREIEGQTDGEREKGGGDGQTDRQTDRYAHRQTQEEGKLTWDSFFR